MPLVKCPACKTQVSVEAEQCPKCGHPKPGAGYRSPKPLSPEALKRVRLKGLLAGAVGLVGMTLYIVFGVGLDNFLSPNAAVEASNETKRAAPTEAQVEVAQKLIDESARLGIVIRLFPQRDRLFVNKLNWDSLDFETKTSIGSAAYFLIWAAHGKEPVMIWVIDHQTDKKIADVSQGWGLRLRD